MAQESPAARGGLRERTRAMVFNEIRSTARALLAAHGVAGLTIRQVSRELGISSPAVYRYFKNHDELVDHVIIDVFEEVVALLREVIATVTEGGTPAKISAASRAFRQWAVEHPHEFSVALVNPIGPREDVHSARWSFAAVFAELFCELWREQPFPVPDRADIDRDLLALAKRFRKRSGIDMPVPDEVVVVFLRNWMRLYGAVCMEAMGQAGVLGDDKGALFKAELAELNRGLGFSAASKVKGSRARR